MKPAKLLEITKRAEMEIEKCYPYVTKLKLQIQLATGSTEKSKYFNVLKKAEAHISAEVTKLRSKPNRATKYTCCMRRLISCMRLMLNYLNKREELEALPTLAVIAVHFFNIMLGSSMTKREPPKCTASINYAFIKMLFDRDVEFVLDVIICSNVAEDAMAEANSVGFFILSEVLRDQHLYLQDSATFAKFCTIAALLKDCKNGKEIVKEAIKDLNSYPYDFKSYIERKYGYPKKERFSVSTVIDNIQPRKVAATTRKERLLVISASEKRHSKEDQQGDSSSSKAGTSKRIARGNNLFYYDVKGSYSGQDDNMEVTSTFQTIDLEDEDEELEPMDGELEVQSDEEEELQESGGKSESASGSDSDGITAIQNDMDVPDMDMESDDENAKFFSRELGSITSLPFEDMYERRKTGSGVVSSSNFKLRSGFYTPADMDEESVESGEDQKSKEDSDEEDMEQGNKMDQGLSLIKKYPDSDEEADKSDSTIPNVGRKPIAAPKLEESDDDIQLIFEDERIPCAAGNNNNEDEERDLAEPESGEDEVPFYGQEDHNGATWGTASSRKNSSTFEEIENHSMSSNSQAKNEPSSPMVSSQKQGTPELNQSGRGGISTRQSVGAKFEETTPPKTTMILNDKEITHPFDVSPSYLIKSPSKLNLTNTPSKSESVKDEETEERPKRVLSKVTPSPEKKSETQPIPKFGKERRVPSTIVEKSDESKFVTRGRASSKIEEIPKSNIDEIKRGKRGRPASKVGKSQIDKSEEPKLATRRRAASKQVQSKNPKLIKRPRLFSKLDETQNVKSEQPKLTKRARVTPKPEDIQSKNSNEPKLTKQVRVTLKLGENINDQSSLIKSKTLSKKPIPPKKTVQKQSTKSGMETRTSARLARKVI